MTNSKQISALTMRFSPASEYNREIFYLYLSSLKQVIFLGRLIHIAETFKIYLEHNDLPKLTDWLSIFDISDHVNIRYGKTGQFCPVLRVARLLELQNKLPPMTRYKELSSIFKAFEDKKVLLIEFYDFLPKGSIDTSVRRFRILLKYHNEYGLLPINSKHVASYCESLNQKPFLATIKTKHLSTVRGFYDWLIFKKIVSTNPFDGLHFGREKITCLGCMEVRSHLRSNLCTQCYIDKVSGKKLSLVESNFKPATAYNGYIFTLYIKYLRRYYLRHCHVDDAIKIANFLNITPVTTIKTWGEIRKLNKLIPNDNILGLGGNGFIKIGRMLEELGVLQHRELDLSSSVNKAFNDLRCPIQPNVKQFIQCLKKSRRSDSSVLIFLKSINVLSSWYFTKYGSEDIFALSRPVIDDFIQKGEPTVQQLHALQRFFAWAVINRLIVQNPLSHFKRNKSEDKIKILPPEKIRRLIGYIKDPKSDPEYAFLLALAIFWGFTAKELAFSTLDDSGETLVIHVYQQALTVKTRRRKTQVLELPSNPMWFLKLQKRFQKKWFACYEKTIKTFPVKRICLPHHYVHNRPMATFTIVNRIYEATLAATNEKIPLNILRATCGTLHIHGTDGSFLTTLGWSKTTAHKYTWCPREYFISDIKSKSSK